MKKRKKILIAINAALAPVLGVLPNFLSASFPSIPVMTLWIVAGIIFAVSTIVSAFVALLEDEKGESQPILQVSSVSQKTKHISNLANDIKTRKVLSSRVKTFSSGGDAVVTNHQPTLNLPLLISLAVDVSHSMKDPIVDQTGKTIERWASVKEALEHFAYLGLAWFKDPTTQQKLPNYYLMAYGFGFTELSYQLGINKKPGGQVRNLLQHPNLTSFPSALEISEHWRDYRDNLLNFKKYTGDLFGTSPMCEVLRIIRDQIKQERTKTSFAIPSLLLIISDGLANDGNPLPIIHDLHNMGVMTLCCYLADQDVLVAKKLYSVEDANWSDGAKLLFQCASPLQRTNNVSNAMFDYLSETGWSPHDGVRLFAQVNQTEGLHTFLEILLRGSLSERKG